MCLCDYIGFADEQDPTRRALVPAAPLGVHADPDALIVDDNLITFINGELVDDAPRTLRQRIRELLGIADGEPVQLLYLSVAHFAGKTAENNRAARLLLKCSTVPIVLGGHTTAA